MVWGSPSFGIAWGTCQTWWSLDPVLDGERNLGLGWGWHGNLHCDSVAQRGKRTPAKDPPPCPSVCPAESGVGNEGSLWLLSCLARSGSDWASKSREESGVLKGLGGAAPPQTHPPAKKENGFLGGRVYTALRTDPGTDQDWVREPPCCLQTTCGPMHRFVAFENIF